MILNVWTVSALFLAAVGSLLAIAAITLSVRLLWASTRELGPGRVDVLADRAHLIALVVTALTVVRLLSWPQLYLLLKSYVPDLAPYGVMCAFGVTEVEPTLVGLLEWARPILVLGLGLWWLMVFVDREARAPVLLIPRTVWLIPLALLALVDCSAEAVYLFREKVGQPVTCCTQFLDTPAASMSATGVLAFGRFAPALTLAVYFGTNMLVIAAATALARASSRRRNWASLAGLMLLGLGNLAVTHRAWVDVVAPRVLGLPYHHCAYELITDIPALGFAALMAVLGNGGLAWPPALLPFRGRAPAAVNAMQAKVYACCAAALAGSLVLVVISAV